MSSPNLSPSEYAQFCAFLEKLLTFPHPAHEPCHVFSDVATRRVIWVDDKRHLIGMAGQDTFAAVLALADEQEELVRHLEPR